MARSVAWFSCGAPSAVMTKLLVAEKPDDLVIAYIDTGSEHEDNHRFLIECEKWFGRDVVQLKSDRYADTWDVWERRRYIVGHEGAPCSLELKKKVRLTFERPDDVQCFGYTVDRRDSARASRFAEQNPGMDLRFPLIEHGLTKADCLAMVERAGIELPLLYRLGFPNANCVGCCKAGMGHWNGIRRFFPEQFERMAKLERELGTSVCAEEGPEGPDDSKVPVFLDELDPERGDFKKERIDCSLMCVLAEQAMEGDA